MRFPSMMLLILVVSDPRALLTDWTVGVVVGGGAPGPVWAVTWGDWRGPSLKMEAN